MAELEALVALIAFWIYLAVADIFPSLLPRCYQNTRRLLGFVLCVWGSLFLIYVADRVILFFVIITLSLVLHTIFDKPAIMQEFIAILFLATMSAVVVVILLHMKHMGYINILSWFNSGVI